MACSMVPADTPVPDGFSRRDIPETVSAKGLYGESVRETIERAKALGDTTSWEPYGWNCELYLQAEEENPPKQAHTPWHWSSGRKSS